MDKERKNTKPETLLDIIIFDIILLDIILLDIILLDIILFLLNKLFSFSNKSLHFLSIELFIELKIYLLNEGFILI
jgi:hypothetical protein